MEVESDEADQQVVLEEEIDENYEPTQSEVLEYAKWLGMDLENEQELLWIAREGLKAPLPEDWKPCQAPSREIYYFNFATGESIWDHPCDEHFRKLYQQEKARLQEQRQLAAQGQQQVGQQPPQQQHDAGAPGAAGARQGLAAHTQQRLDVTASNASAISRTAVEPLQLPLSSPTGTLSTLPSATTASMAESPVGGLARDNMTSMFMDTSAKGAAVGMSRGTSSGGTTPSAAAHDWQAAADAADQEQRRMYRQRLDEDRRLWEQRLQNDMDLQQATLQDQQQHRLWSLQQQLEEQMRQTAQQLKVEHDAQLQGLQLDLESTVVQQARELEDAKQRHASRMAEIQSQQATVEANASAMLQQAHLRLSTSALSETELTAVRETAAAAAEVEAKADATAKKVELLKSAMEEVNQEVAAEVEAYRSNRRAAALQELTGQLDSDTAAVAAKLEQQAAELQRLESAVADKAAVLQKLNDQLESKVQQGHGSNAADTIALQAARCRDQLSNVQQQLQQGQKQLDSADAALTAQRTAIAEAEQQLASLKQDISVCEPRLAGLRQQLQELESNIRARELEHQQRSADLLLASRRLQELREEVARRQEQLAQLDSLYNERQEALRAAAAELARRRGELSTLESGLSDSLRRKADAEYQALEEALRRTRKAAADAGGELSAKQISLSNTSSQLAASQAQLEGVEVGLAAKRKELQEVLGQLQAAAAQEFQNARKLLLEEESRLLDSERRTMQARVADLIEAERRAALAAGRRRMERQVEAQLAQEQAVLLARRQDQVQKWLEADGSAQAAVIAGLQGAGSSAQTTAGVVSNTHSPALATTTTAAAAAAAAAGRPSSGRQSAGVAAMLGGLRLVQQDADVAGSVRSMPEHGSYQVANSSDAAAAAASASTRRRTRSLSPDTKGRKSGTLAAEQAVEQLDQLSRHSRLQNGGEERSNGPTEAAAGEEANASAAVNEGAGVAAALQSQLQALAARSSLGGMADAAGNWSRLLSEATAQAEPTHIQQQVLKGMHSPQLSAYSSLLQQAKQFVRQRRREIQQRQEAVLAAQADWKAALAATEQRQQQQEGEGDDTGQAVQQLRQLKHVLQDQIHELNNETRQLKALKAQVQQLEVYVAVLEQQEAVQQVQHDAAAPASLTGIAAASQQHRSSGLAFTPTPPHNKVQRAQQQLPLYSNVSNNMLPQRESSLDKVAAALQHALHVASGLPGAAGSAAGSRRVTASSRRSSSGAAFQPRPPTGSQLQHGAASSSAYGGGLDDSGSDGVAPSVLYLEKLRGERASAQGLMQQHSQWLAGFREQVARVAHALHTDNASLNGRHPPQLQHQHQQVAREVGAAAGGGAGRHSSFSGGGGGGGGGGDMLSPIASSAFLTPRSGQPMTLDLGSQQLVISLVPKSA